MGKTEEDIKGLVYQRLSNDFYLRSEVVGKHWTGKRVRIDFLARPKRHIASVGFLDRWFGIETKYIKPFGRGKQLNKLLWQAITYRNSTYYPSDLSLPFVFVCFNFDGLENDAPIDSLIRFCQYANVGTLRLKDLNYYFRFSAAYFSFRDGIYFKCKGNVGLKRYIGNTDGFKTYV